MRRRNPHTGLVVFWIKPRQRGYNVETLLLSTVKRCSKFVLNVEEVFGNEKQAEKPKQNQSELHRFQKRYDELTALIHGLYENLVSGLLPERQYKQLMKQYDDKQAELEAKIETMKKALAEEKVNTVNIKHFISLIHKCKKLTKISDLTFHEFIDKIVVYATEGLGKVRTQKVDIYFNYVGQVDIAYTEEEWGQDRNLNFVISQAHPSLIDLFANQIRRPEKELSKDRLSVLTQLQKKVPARHTQKKK